MARPKSKQRVPKKDEILAWIVRRCDQTCSQIFVLRRLFRGRYPSPHGV